MKWGSCNETSKVYSQKYEARSTEHTTLGERMLSSPDRELYARLRTVNLARFPNALDSSPGVCKTGAISSTVPSYQGSTKHSGLWFAALHAPRRPFRGRSVRCTSPALCLPDATTNFATPTGFAPSQPSCFQLVLAAATATSATLSAATDQRGGHLPVV